MRTELFEAYTCKYCGNHDPDKFTRVDSFDRTDGGIFYVCKCLKCKLLFNISYSEGVI